MSAYELTKAQAALARVALAEFGNAYGYEKARVDALIAILTPEDPVQTDQIRCPTCGGRGLRPMGAPCSSCRGSGRWPPHE